MMLRIVGYWPRIAASAAWKKTRPSMQFLAAKAGAEADWASLDKDYIATVADANVAYVSATADRERQRRLVHVCFCGRAETQGTPAAAATARQVTAGRLQDGGCARYHDGVGQPAEPSGDSQNGAA
jgi:hypothetical protein